jgi:hypothetical protein
LLNFAGARKGSAVPLVRYRYVHGTKVTVQI